MVIFAGCARETPPGPRVAPSANPGPNRASNTYTPPSQEQPTPSNGQQPAPSQDDQAIAYLQWIETCDKTLNQPTADDDALMQKARQHAQEAQRDAQRSGPSPVPDWQNDPAYQQEQRAFFARSRSNFQSILGRVENTVAPPPTEPVKAEYLTYLRAFISKIDQAETAQEHFWNGIGSISELTANQQPIDTSRCNAAINTACTILQIQPFQLESSPRVSTQNQQSGF